MTAAEHKQAAEDLLASLQQPVDFSPESQVALTAAQIHALLATIPDPA